MDTTAAPTTEPSVTAIDDVWIPPPPLLPISLRETYVFSVIARNEGNERELFTRVYITADSADRRSPQEHAAEWIRKNQADSEAQFKLAEQGGVPVPGVPPIRDHNNKVVREPYRVVFERQGVKDYPGKELDKTDRYIQYFYFLPVSATEVVTVRQVRKKKNDSPNSAFSKQFQHFLATLKVEAATPQSSIAGSGPRLRRFYTAHLSFEIPTGDADTGNQWSIDHGAKRIDTWRTPQGDIGVTLSIINGYTFRVADENKHLQQVAKDLVANLAGAVKAINPDADVKKQTYLQKKIGPYEMYGHKGANEDSTSAELDLAYKTGKQFTLTFGGPTAAINAAEPAIYEWLAKFQFLP